MSLQRFVTGPFPRLSKRGVVCLQDWRSGFSVNERSKDET